MLRIQKLGTYRKKGTGKLVFRYGVSGSAAELAEYKANQGEFYREDQATGKPLFFSDKFAGESTGLIKTSTGRYIADMSAFDQAASLVGQYGGNFGQAIAERMAASLLGAGATAAVPAAKAAETVVEKPLDEV